jgi:hypothetical protein
MDTADHHYSTSILSKFKNKIWWNADQGWKNKYIDRDPAKGRRKLIWNINYPVQLTDAWHFFKMLMIIFTAAAILTFPHQLTCLLGYVIWFILLGILWNSIFSLMYDAVLKK